MDKGTNTTIADIDAYTPAQVAARIETAGVAKAELPTLQTLALAVLAQPEGRREDDGSVLTLVYDSHTALSQVLVLEARTLAPQARVRLTQAIPLTFHGSWWPTPRPPH